MSNIYLCLQDLLKKLKEANAATAYLDTDISLAKDIKSAIKRVYIATALHNKTVFSIMGGQGAGKTKLLRSLYDLNTDWLADNEGRGEKMPILVLESDAIEEPYAAIDRLVEDESGKLLIEQGTKVLTPVDFHRAIRGEYADSLLPTLFVPRRYFSDNQSGFVLLPGYEQVNSDNKVWQNLMKHALAFSSGAVVVTDQTRLANQTQMKINKDIQEKYFTDSKPLFVVSKTESLNEKGKLDLLDRCKDVFSISDYEQDRIIFSGDGSELIKRWRPELEQSLNTYALQNIQSVNEKCHLIADLIEDIQDIEISIKEIESDFEVSKLSEQRQVDSLLMTLDTSCKKLRSGYQKALRAELDNYSSPVLKELDEVYQEKYEGVINKGKNFFKSDINLSRSVNADIETQWNKNKDGNEGKGFKDSHTSVLSQVIATEISRIWPSSNMLSTEEDPVKNEADIDDGVIRVIQHIFRKNDSKQLINDDKRDLKTAIKLLPVLMLEYVRLGQQSPNLQVNVDGDVEASDVLGSINKVAEDMESASVSTKRIVKAMASMLAADVLMDGNIDTIPALINAVTGGAIEAGSLASSATLVVPAMIGVAFGIHSLLERISEIDKARLGYIRTSIETITDNHFQNYVDHFDDLMDLLRDALEERLSSIYGIDDQLGYKHALLKANTNLERTRIDLKAAMGKYHVLA